MKVICAGVPKSGTKSITKALHHPGFTAFHWEEQIFDFLGLGPVMFSKLESTRMLIHVTLQLFSMWKFWKPFLLAGNSECCR